MLETAPWWYVAYKQSQDYDAKWLPVYQNKTTNLLTHDYFNICKCRLYQYFKWLQIVKKLIWYKQSVQTKINY